MYFLTSRKYFFLVSFFIYITINNQAMLKFQNINEIIQKMKSCSGYEGSVNIIDASHLAPGRSCDLSVRKHLYISRSSTSRSSKIVSSDILLGLLCSLQYLPFHSGHNPSEY